MLPVQDTANAAVKSAIPASSARPGTNDALRVLLTGMLAADRPIDRAEALFLLRRAYPSISQSTLDDLLLAGWVACLSTRAAQLAPEGNVVRLELTAKGKARARRGGAGGRQGVVVRLKLPRDETGAVIGLVRRSGVAKAALNILRRQDQWLSTGEVVGILCPEGDPGLASAVHTALRALELRRVVESRAFPGRRVLWRAVPLERAARSAEG